MSSKPKIVISKYALEHRASLLKERIYSTIVLLAVLVSINPNHSEPFSAFLIITGTTISSWAASLIAAGMARHIIMKDTVLNSKDRVDHFSEHLPILAAATFPAVVTLLSMMGVFSLYTAINISIGYCLLLMILWSLLSARSLGAKKWLTLIIASLELGIGIGIVLLKISVGH